MTRYRRNFVAGGSYFFTVNPVECRARLRGWRRLSTQISSEGQISILGSGGKGGIKLSFKRNPAKA